MQVEYSFKIIPLNTDDIKQSGDLAFIKEDENMLYIGLIDALGHGKPANIAAIAAVRYLKDSFTSNLIEVMNEMHVVLKGSRGAAASLCCLNKNNGELLFCGIGNITTKVLTTQQSSFVCRDGILGYNIPSPRVITRTLYPGDILLMYSDGVKSNIDLLDCPNLEYGSAEDITNFLMEKYSKPNDDASLITLKVLKNK